MKEDNRKSILILTLSCIVLLACWDGAKGQINRDTTTLRISVHVFDRPDRTGNFHPDSTAHNVFLKDVVDWINHRMFNLDTLRPVVPSPYIKSLGVQIRTDSIFYHTDTYAWDCSEGIDSDYMRQVYVDQDSSLNYRQKYRTLPIFLGGNYSIVGGHNSLIGDKWFIAMRGLFSEYQNRPYHDAVRDCGRGILHELGHSLGLSHNFSGGAHGDQCDECEDNGCPEEGTSNNIMDYWPSYGYAISECQKKIIWEHLDGSRGNIAEVIVNDSCYKVEDQVLFINDGTDLIISDTSYLHSDLVVRKGGSLLVKSYLSVPDSCSIIVETGAKLTVDGGTLGNLCGDVWEGVYVMHNDSDNYSNISFSGARVENARMGITIEGRHELSIDQTYFYNNLSSVKFSDCPGNEVIENCRFEIIGRLNHWEEWQAPQSFVWLENTNSIEIRNCSFYNSEGHRNYGDLYSGIGIIAYNSSLKLSSSTFENLYKGIVAGADFSVNTLSVDSCDFTLNHCNIQLAGLTQGRVSNSFFNLNKLNTLPVYGIVAGKSKYLEINNNVFYSDYGGENLTGIVSDFEEAGTHLIHHNDFSLVDRGIVALYSDSVLQWPGALLKYSFEELTEAPMGSIWFLNQFRDVKNMMVSLNSEGGGILRSTGGEYKLFSVDWSNSFKGAGFGPYSRSRDVCIVIPDEAYMLRQPSGMLFDILSVNSWYDYDTTDIKPVHSREVFSSLVSEFNNGMKLLENKLSASHEGMVAVAAHIEQYPWIVCTPQFEQYLDRELFFIPSWIWHKVKEALDTGNWWKKQLHQFIISMANSQMNIVDTENVKDFGYPADGFSVTAFKQVEFDVSREAGRLNPGLIAYSSLPSFDIVPNPTHRKVGIRFKNEYPGASRDGGLEWIMRDFYGRIISKGFMYEAGDLIIDPGVIPSGSYFMEIWNQNEFLGIQKFIILAD